MLLQQATMACSQVFLFLSSDQPTIKSPLTRHAFERFGKILHDAAKSFCVSNFSERK